MAARPPAAEPFPALSHVPEAAQLIIRGDLPPDVPVIRITRAEYRGIAERVGLFISDGESRLGIIDESNPAFVEALNAYVAARDARHIADQAAAADEAKRIVEAAEAAMRQPPPVLEGHALVAQSAAVPGVHPPPMVQPPPQPPQPPAQSGAPSLPRAPPVSSAQRLGLGRKRRGIRLSSKKKGKVARRAVVPAETGSKAPRKGAAPSDFDDEVPDAEALELKRRVVLCENSDVYFEKQVLKQCYKHAVNNNLGSEVVTVDDLDAEARVLAARALKPAPGTGDPVRCAWYDVYDGLYSTSVIHNALVKKGYRLVRVGHEDYQRIPDMPAGKFLVAIEYGVKDAQGHWMNHVIAVDCDRRLVLDSQGNKPLALDRATFARKTGPNARYPRTRIARVHRIVRQPRKASMAPHAS